MSTAALAGELSGQQWRLNHNHFLIASGDTLNSIRVLNCTSVNVPRQNQPVDHYCQPISCERKGYSQHWTTVMRCHFWMQGMGASLCWHCAEEAVIASWVRRRSPRHQTFAAQTALESQHPHASWLMRRRAAVSAVRPPGSWVATVMLCQLRQVARRLSQLAARVQQTPHAS